MNATLQRRMGQGVILGVLGISPILSAQSLVDLRTQTRDADFTNFPFTRPMKTGTALPSSCTVGDFFLKTDAAAGQNVYACIVANTWTLQAGGLSDPGSNGLVLRTGPGATSSVAAPTGAVVGTSDTQTLTNKSIDASQINSGTLGAARLPAFSGDISTAAGTTAATLATVNSGPGTYGDSTHSVQVTVDAKGRITAITPVTINAGSGGGAQVPAAGIVKSNGSTLQTATGGVDYVRPSDSITGNAATATALAANGTNCPSGQVPAGVDAVGNAEGCGQVIYANILGTPALYNQSLAVNGTALTQRPTANFSSAFALSDNSGASRTDIDLATVNSNAGTFGDSTHAVQVTVDVKGRITAIAPVAITATSGGSSLQAPAAGMVKSDGTNLQTATGGVDYVRPSDSITGNAATATALAANGTNCPSGQVPTGVDAAGNAEGCTTLANQTVAANGTARTQRPTANFSSAFTVTDNSGASRTDIDLATVNSNTGTFGDSTHIPIVTVNAKGQVTGVSTVSASGGGGGSTGSAVAAGPLASIPSGCSPGDLYVATDQPAGQQIYACTASNVWTQFVALGPSGALAFTNGSLDVVTTVVPFLGSPNTFTGLNTFANGVQLQESNAQPTCSSAIRGTFWYLNNGSSKDNVQVCVYTGSAFAWVNLY